MTKEQEQHQQFLTLLIQTFKSFQDFCQLNHLTYFAAGGTALGAIRHKGLIPWDDDIDVYMPRKDYNRLLELKESLVGSNYEIIDPRDEGYYCLMAKYSYRNSTLWEYKDIPFSMGVYVDVFALDFFDGTREDALKQRKHFDKHGALFRIGTIQRSWKSIGLQLVQGQFSKGLWQLFQKCVIRPLRPFFRHTILSYPKVSSGEWIVAYSGASAQKDVYRAIWFEETKTFPFEDTTIEVPSGYEEYLRHMYGNYMQLPPEEKRVSHHPHYFLDLERRLSVEEIVSVLKSK